MIFFEKEYSDESLVDIEEDVYDAISQNPLLQQAQEDSGFRPGTFKVTIEWTNDDE